MSRTPRNTLSREAIVEAALAVAARDGGDALTMRRVARELRAAPMALYNHVTSRDDLLDAMFEVVLADVPFPDIAVGTWQEQLRAGWSAFRDSLRRHAALVPLVFARGGTGGAYLRATEHSLAILRNAGFDAEAALHANRLAVAFTFGSVMNELGAATLGPVHVPDGYPMLHDSAPYLADPDYDAAWTFALSTVIAGLEAQLTAGRRRRRPARRAR